MAAYLRADAVRELHADVHGAVGGGELAKVRTVPSGGTRFTASLLARTRPGSPSSRESRLRGFGAEATMPSLAVDISREGLRAGSAWKPAMAEGSGVAGSRAIDGGAGPRDAGTRPAPGRLPAEGGLGNVCTADPCDPCRGVDKRG